jgi:hypothetical protein
MHLLLMVVNVVITPLKPLSLLIWTRHLSWLIFQWIILSLFVGRQVMVIYACQNLPSSILTLLLCVFQDYNNNNPWLPSCKLLEFIFMFWVEFFFFFPSKYAHVCYIAKDIHFAEIKFLSYELLMWHDYNGCSCGRPVCEVICSIYCLTQDFLKFRHQTLWI